MGIAIPLQAIHGAMTPTMKHVKHGTWRAAPTLIGAAADDIHVWLVRAGDVRNSELWHADLLSLSEKQRAESFKFARDRDLFVAAHVALRSILSRYLRTPAAEIDFTAGPHGKPSLASASHGHVRFNLSHSGDLALVAVALGREVGIDLEFIKKEFAFDELAERFFTAREVAALRALPSRLQRRAFFKCWSSKEAFLKAKGTGLGGELDEVEILLERGEDVRIDAAIPGWSLTEINPGRYYAAALASAGDPPKTHLYRWTP
jgi:4'-phosphopantetheinyl transferase